MWDQWNEAGLPENSRFPAAQLAALSVGDRQVLHRVPCRGDLDGTMLWVAVTGSQPLPLAAEGITDLAGASDHLCLMEKRGKVDVWEGEWTNRHRSAWWDNTMRVKEIKMERGKTLKYETAREEKADGGEKGKQTVSRRSACFLHCPDPIDWALLKHLLIISPWTILPQCIVPDFSLFSTAEPNLYLPRGGQGLWEQGQEPSRSVCSCLLCESTDPSQHWFFSVSYSWVSLEGKVISFKGLFGFVYLLFPRAKNLVGKKKIRLEKPRQRGRETSGLADALFCTPRMASQSWHWLQ